MLRRVARWLLMFAGPALAAALGSDRALAALDEGRPACDYCRMIFTDHAFGAEIATRSRGLKIYDAIECMVAAVLTDSVPPGEIRTLSLVDHVAPHARVELSRAVFLYCPSIESPMGQSLLAFRSRAQAARACRGPGGRVLDWRGVLTRVDSVWFQGKLDVAPHLRPGTPAPARRTAR